MAAKKITFQVPVTLWASFTVQTKKLFLNRAPFLDHMLAMEIPRVSSDLGNFVMSPKARRYISGELAKADAKAVNIEIRAETARALEEVVKKHGLVRDALICRLIIFLRGSDALFKYLEMPNNTDKFRGGVTGMSTSPMKALEDIYGDPLYYIRAHLLNTQECGIYDCELPRSWDWVVCRIKDEDVRGTKANIQMKQEQARDAALFELLEADLFSAENKASTGSIQ